MNVLLALAVLAVSLAVLVVALDAPAVPRGRKPINLVPGRDFWTSRTIGPPAIRSTGSVGGPVRAGLTPGRSFPGSPQRTRRRFPGR